MPVPVLVPEKHRAPSSHAAGLFWYPGTSSFLCCMDSGGNPPGQTLCSCSISGYEWGPGPKHPLTSPGGNHSHPSPAGQWGDTNPCQEGTGWGSGCVYGVEEAAGAAGSLLGTARWQAGSAVPLALGEGLGAGQPLGCSGQGCTGPYRSLHGVCGPARFQTPNLHPNLPTTPSSAGCDAGQGAGM